MSYNYPTDERLGRAPPQLYQASEYQIHEPPRQPPRANTPERIRERQVKNVRLLSSQACMSSYRPSRQVKPPYAHKPRDADFYMRDPTDGRVKPNPELRDDSRVKCKYFTKCGGCQYQVRALLQVVCVF